MYDSKIIELLKEMKENCLKADKVYNDPKSGDKAEALNYAIFAIERLNTKDSEELKD